MKVLSTGTASKPAIRRLTQDRDAYIAESVSAPGANHRCLYCGSYVGGQWPAHQTQCYGVQEARRRAGVYWDRHYAGRQG